VSGPVLLRGLALGAALLAAASASAGDAPGGRRPGADERAALATGLGRWAEAHADRVHGGFGTAPKRPHARLLLALLERPELRGDAGRRAHLARTLDAILAGLYDPVDGGFFRAAAARDWRAPDTAKPLALNVGLARVYLRAAQAFGEPRYAKAADGTVAWLLRWLYDPLEGGFHGAQGAAPAYYRLPAAERRAARKPAVSLDKPTAANGEAITGFFELGRATGRQDLLRAARLSLEFAQRHLVGAAGVFEVYRVVAIRGEGRGGLDASAWAARAFLEAHAIYKKQSYRDLAEAILDRALAEGVDSATGALEDTGLLAEALLIAAGLPDGRRAYRDAAARLLGVAGGRLRALLVDGRGATPAAVEGAMPALAAWGRLSGTAR